MPEEVPRESGVPEGLQRRHRREDQRCLRAAWACSTASATSTRRSSSPAAAARTPTATPRVPAACCSPRIGFSKLPERFTKELEREEGLQPHGLQLPRPCSTCARSWPGRRWRRRADASRRTPAARRCSSFPVQAPRPSPLELSWAPGPIANSRFTEEEMAQITAERGSAGFEKFAPGWKIADCGTEMDPGLHGRVRRQEERLRDPSAGQEHRLHALEDGRDSRRARRPRCASWSATTSRATGR